MKLKKNKNNSQGPSSAIGIMNFKDSLSGPKIPPEVIIGVAIAFVVVVVFLKAAVF